MIEEIRNHARDLGVDLLGVAELTAAHDFILMQGGEHIAEFPRAVSIGMRLLDPVMDKLYRHEEPSPLYS